jgi:hypothetical protein
VSGITFAPMFNFSMPQWWVLRGARAGVNCHARGHYVRRSNMTGVFALLRSATDASGIKFALALVSALSRAQARIPIRMCLGLVLWYYVDSAYCMHLGLVGH